MRHGTRQLSGERARHGAWHPATGLVLRRRVVGFYSAVDTISGGIGFVGIVVPHLLRLIAGPDHRWLLINSGLLGASVLIAADMVSRTVIAPAELPIGIVTAMIGGPFFMWVLLSNRRLLDA